MLLARVFVSKVDPEGAGRVPVIEAMVMTGRVVEAITDPDRTHSIIDLIKEGEFYGMQTFDRALFDLYQSGSIQLQDAVAGASSPHDFKLMLENAGIMPNVR